MLAQALLAEQAYHHLGAGPDFRGDICELHRLCAIPKYRGPSPGTFRVRGLPHHPNEQTFIMTKLWQYVIAGKMFLCAPQCIHQSEKYLCSPSTTVAKKLPVRTISADKRAILDVRRVDLRCLKSDYWPVETPSIDDLAIQICRLRASFPDIPILGRILISARLSRDVDYTLTVQSCLVPNSN